MNTPTELYPLRGADGQVNDSLTPHEIVKRIALDEVSPARAWREYFGLTQPEVADKLGISCSIYAEQEAQSELSDSERIAIANALGINPELLD